MKVELTLSIQQLAGKLPFYIKGRKYWLLNEKSYRDLQMVKAEARRNADRLQTLIDLAISRRTK